MGTSKVSLKSSNYPVIAEKKKKKTNQHPETDAVLQNGHSKGSEGNFRHSIFYNAFHIDDVF